MCRQEPSSQLQASGRGAPFRSHARALLDPQSLLLTSSCPERCSKEAEARAALLKTHAQPHQVGDSSPHTQPSNVMLKDAGPRPGQAGRASTDSHRFPPSLTGGEEQPVCGLLHVGTRDRIHTRGRHRASGATWEGGTAWSRAGHPVPDWRRHWASSPGPGRGVGEGLASQKFSGLVCLPSALGHPQALGAVAPGPSYALASGCLLPGSLAPPGLS